MWTRSFIALPAALLAAAAGSASADTVVWTGEVAGGNSWTASFQASSASQADFIGVRITSEGDSLEDSAFLNFSNAGWDNYGHYGEMPLLAGAAGPDFSSMGFTVHFAGDTTDPVAFELVLFSGEAVASVFGLTWDGSNFGIVYTGSEYAMGRSDFEGGATLVPLPTAAGLAGVGLLAAAPRRSRRG